MTVNQPTHFTIPLPPVTKKNSQRILVNRKTGAPFIAPSQKFKEYEREAGYFVTKHKYVIPVNVKAVFYMPTRRKCDLTNLLEALDDILVNYGVVPDDDYTHIAAHDGSRVLYDKNNPRTEVFITACGDLHRIPAHENTKGVQT